MRYILVQIRSLINGTTCAAYDGTCVESAAILLAKVLGKEPFFSGKLYHASLCQIHFE